jgi:hypothetical protein
VAPLDGHDSAGLHFYHDGEDRKLPMRQFRQLTRLSVNVCDSLDALQGVLTVRKGSER